MDFPRRFAEMDAVCGPRNQIELGRSYSGHDKQSK